MHLKFVRKSAIDRESFVLRFRHFPTSSEIGQFYNALVTVVLNLCFDSWPPTNQSKIQIWSPNMVLRLCQPKLSVRDPKVGQESHVEQYCSAYTLINCSSIRIEKNNGNHLQIFLVKCLSILQKYWWQLILNCILRKNSRKFPFPTTTNTMLEWKAVLSVSKGIYPQHIKLHPNKRIMTWSCVEPVKRDNECQTH